MEKERAVKECEKSRDASIEGVYAAFMRTKQS